MSGRVEGFELRDRQAAHNFAIAAKQCGVRRVIYLGGLAATGGMISAHLKSRHETGAVLREFGPPLVELRAGTNGCANDDHHRSASSLFCGRNNAPNEWFALKNRKLLWLSKADRTTGGEYDRGHSHRTIMQPLRWQWLPWWEH